MDYKYILGVTTCKKNLHLATKQYNDYLTDIDKYPILYIKYYGDPSIECDYVYNNNELILKCEDDYLNLPYKVFMFFKVVKKLFPNIKGVLKVDDDIKINLPKLFELLENNQELDYYGKIAYHSEPYSVHLQSKPDIYEIFKIAKIKVSQCDYCAGCAYYISKKSLDIITKDTTYYRPFNNTIKIDYDLQTNTIDNLHLFEDVNVAVILKNKNILPTRVDLKPVVDWDGITANSQISISNILRRYR